MNIDDANDDPALMRTLAQLLVDGFRDHWSDAWPTMSEGYEEVRRMLQPGRICRVAVENGAPVGWIGGIHEYAFVWELHPLVVREDRRGHGIGRALVEDLERLVSAAGGLTLRVGTDDEDGMTSLGGVDLYPDPLVHLATMTDRKHHPFGFYRKLGFAVTGVVPDANGFGKPDIMMTKRISRDLPGPATKRP